MFGIATIRKRNGNSGGEDGGEGSSSIDRARSWASVQRRRLRTAQETVRFTATVPKITDDALREISDELGVTKSAAVNYVLAKGLIVEGIQAEGGIIQALMPDGIRLEVQRDESAEAGIALVEYAT